MKQFRDEWLLKHVQQIVENYQSVNNSETQRDFFSEKARLAIDEGSKGRISVTREEQMVVLEELLRTARTQARGVSYIAFKDRWHTQVGRNYSRENERAVRNGIRITRIFISPRDRVKEWIGHTGEKTLPVQ